MMVSVSLGLQFGETRFIFEQFLADLERRADDLDDVRASRRIQVSGPVLVGVRLNPTERFQPVHRGWVLDLSSVGIGFLLDHELRPGLPMHINLEPIIRRECVLPIRVVYHQRCLPHTYRVGAFFTLATNE